MLEYSGFIKFRVDPFLSSDLRRVLELVLQEFKDAEVEELRTDPDPGEERFLIDFISETSSFLAKPARDFRICLRSRNQDLFSFSLNLEDSSVDAVLDDQLDPVQIDGLVRNALRRHVQEKEREVSLAGIRNVRRFEARVRTQAQKLTPAQASFNSEDLLNYAQELVNLEKNLIHAEDLPKQEKVLKLFAKKNLERAKFQFHTGEKLSRVQVTKNLLLLPRHRGKFLALDLGFDDEDYRQLVKKLFFFYTLIGFFRGGQEVADPFFDEALWERVLDNIPFPLALLSKAGEVHQHNTLFAKLGLAPLDCLKLAEKEKVLVSDIPYNVFRKELHHLDEDKILFVFFTESFFLKGEGNLTPTGQELGIISSSIAHELNNPIAGIQAALTLLLLDESASGEAKATLLEMKNGSVRCKQLIETFLGFSSRSPRGLQTFERETSPIEICYKQAQNLLRFRTVESGIRFSFEASSHSTFRAPVNVSLLTMTFYLLLGEIMTLYSHQLLVTNKNQIEKVIKGEIIESSQEITIQLFDLNVSGLTLSKLIQNLLNIENFVLQISDYSLRFIYNP